MVPGSRESNPLEEANESPASRYYSQSRPAINFQSIEADGGMADAQERLNTLAQQEQDFINQERNFTRDNGKVRESS